MATRTTVKKQTVKKKGPRGGKPAPLPEASERLIEELLMRTKERWLKDSSLAILCCTENRVGM